MSGRGVGRNGALRTLVVLLVVGALVASGEALALRPASKGVSCAGPFAGSAHALVVPAGAVCTLEATAKISKNVDVEPTGSLIVQGAKIGGSVVAVSPAGIQIGGPVLSAISKHVKITGVTGHLTGANFICNAKIGGNVLVEGAAATAGPIVIGDAPSCSAGDHFSKNLDVRSNATAVDVSSSTIGQSLEVEGNTAGVTVSENHASQNLVVRANSGGVTVSSNSSGRTARCEGNMPTTEGSGNTAHRGNTCPL
ncbi:MAG TPA: hypothetical protein VMI13_09495 [Solirubrobacteraceae bacterium]|nr:hypothetical protein [Solirubrobacteraceae bacterium]